MVKTLSLFIFLFLAVLEPIFCSLRPSSELSSNCFNFPSLNFDRTNCVKCTYGKSPHFFLEPGDSAIDFTLHDLEGNPHTLSDYLKQKPVVILFGMATCPAYQGLGTTYPFDQCSYEYEYDITEKYKDQIQFFHIVSVEPHPLVPDTNFDSGKILANYWSTIRQPRTWEDRIAITQQIAANTHKSAILLTDYFTGNPYSDLNNPLFCSYAAGARTVTLVGQDGTVEYTREWFRAADLEQAIETYLYGLAN